MNPDFLVIGAGVAGLRAAIELAEAGTVLVVAKDSLRESSSEYAQGGIAVALSDDDEVELHEQDTLYAGDGLCDPIAGREIARTLYHKASSLPNVTFRSYAATTELLVEDGVAGAMIWDADARSEFPFSARAVLLATGGLCFMFLNTTNPDVATGDGVAMAYRAGAEIGDIEFVQFHPTALAV